MCFGAFLGQIDGILAVDIWVLMANELQALTFSKKTFVSMSYGSSKDAGLCKSLKPHVEAHHYKRMH